MNRKWVDSEPISSWTIIISCYRLTVHSITVHWPTRLLRRSNRPDLPATSQFHCDCRSSPKKNWVLIQRIFKYIFSSTKILWTLIDKKRTLGWSRQPAAELFLPGESLQRNFHTGARRQSSPCSYYKEYSTIGRLQLRAADSNHRSSDPGERALSIRTNWHVFSVGWCNKVYFPEQWIKCICNGILINVSICFSFVCDLSDPCIVTEIIEI